MNPFSSQPTAISAAPLTHHFAAPAKPTHRFLARASAVTAGMFAFALTADPALADLPTAVAASGAASGDYIEILKQYFKLGLLALGLIIAVIAFLNVGGGLLAMFNSFRTGRAELGDLGMFAVLGVVILVLVMYLLNEAAVIIT